MAATAKFKHLPVIVVTLSVLLQAVQCQDSLQLVEGDVTLAAMFSINNVRDGRCGEYDVETLKDMMAVKWFLESLNDINYIPGVRLGLEAYRTCKSAEKATSSAVNLLEKYRVLDDDAQTINTTTPLLGLLGPDRTEDAIVVSRFLSSLPSSRRLLLLSGSATGEELTDRNLFSNFFRVIPPDSIQVQVLLKLLQQLHWNYIAIVYDNDAYGTQAAVKLRTLLTNAGICVPSFTSLPLDYTSDDFIRAADSIIDGLRGTGGFSIIPGVVFIGSADTAKEFISLLADRASYVRFIFSEALGLQTSVVAGSRVGKGALATAPPYLPLPEFRVYWNSLWTNRTLFSAEMQTNAWLAEYFTTLTSCALLDYSCWDRKQNLLPLIQSSTQWFFEYYQVKAAAAFASILKQRHSRTCSQGVCLQLKELIRNDRGQIQETLESEPINFEAGFSGVTSIFAGQTNVRFSAEGEITPGDHNGSLYNVFNYKACETTYCFQQVATYQLNGDLEVDTETLTGYDDDGSPLPWPSFPKSQCMDGLDCLECLPSDIPDEVIFVPGDFYIVAVASVHDRMANSPLQCGAIRRSEGADLVQSVLFALGEVNNRNAPFTDIFSGTTKTLGVVVLNSCFRELVIKEKLIELHKGTLMLPDGRNSSDIIPHIAGYVGAFFSTISVSMYEVLSKVDKRFIMLSPTNTSPVLSDRNKYPLYMRLSTGQYTQAKAVLTLVRNLGHQYVQVIYDPDDVYTSAMKETLNSLSSTKAFNICVVNNIASSADDSSFYSVLDELRKNRWASLVVVVLQAEHTTALLRDILPEMTSSDKFHFLGTDGWARSPEVLTVPNNDRLTGSLTFSVELPFNQLFAEYFRNTDPLNATNPWLKYFWEEREGCYLDGSFQRMGKTGQCGQDLTSQYNQGTWVPFYINAIYAFALGLDLAMRRHCGQPYLCNTLTSQNMVDAFKEVRLDLYNSGVSVNVFDNNSDGDVAYKLYQVSVDADASSSSSVAMTYEEMGRYEHDSLTLDRHNLWILTNLEKSECPNADACQACFPPVPDSMGNVVSDDSSDGALIGTVVVICILIIAIIVLVVVLVIAVRKLRAQKRDNDDKVVFASSAATADSRPLPPVRQQSEPYNMAINSSRPNPSPSGGGSAASAPAAVASHYDYLYDYSHADPSLSRHSYLQPVGPMATNASASGGSREGSGHSSLSSSTLPPLPESATESNPGYVARESGGQLQDVVLGRGLDVRGNGPPGERDKSEPRGTTQGLSLVFENEHSPSGDTSSLSPPTPCYRSMRDDPDYLTPSADYLTPSLSQGMNENE